MGYSLAAHLLLLVALVVFNLVPPQRAQLSDLPIASQRIYLYLRWLVKMKKAVLRVQQWGNSLAVRIPAAVARSAHFRLGQAVEVQAEDSAVVVRSVGRPKLTLAQKLAAFDRAKHGAEVLSTVAVGRETI